jgi:signal transduction histidine kinase
LLAVTRDITEKKKAEDLLKKSYKDIRRLATHLEQVREDERIRIARDLHDELGQQLTVLKLDISWMRKKISGKEEMIQQKITELLSTVDNTIKTVRRISTELRPSVLDDLGLVAAMEWQSNEFEKRTGIETNLNSEIKELKLPVKIATGLFRIFQESLTNVARHADATSVNALLGIENGKIRMQIVDNGKGFDQQTIENKKTLGILGMRERAKIMGGEYSIESLHGRGSVIEVKVPISSNTSI